MNAGSFGHIMVDIETMGKGSKAAIVAIGAVEFDINTGHTGRTFYTNIDLQSCLDAGLEVDGSTVYWWLGQQEEARLSLLQNPIPLPEALLLFVSFLEVCGGRDLQVWGNSARFDLGKLDDAYTACRLKLPWRFTNERDVRTLVAFAPEIKAQEIRVGVHHNALADCYHQISYCSKIWANLNSSASVHLGMTKRGGYDSKPV